MSSDKKNKFEIEITEKTKDSLEQSLKRLKTSKHLPLETTIENYIEIILSNYVQSYIAMENLNQDLFSDLKSKFETFFTPGEVNSEEFWKKMLNSLNTFLNPEENVNKKENKESDLTKVKGTENDKKKS